MGLFTSAFHFKKLRDTLLTPPTDGRGVYNNRRKIVYAKCITGFGLFNPSPSGAGRNTDLSQEQFPTPDPIARPGTTIAQLNHGFSYKKVNFQIPLTARLSSFDDAVSNQDADFNPTREGYYIGTPDFRIEYNTDRSAYEINNLHQSWRVPQYDQYGNIMYKQHCKVSELEQAGGGDNPNFLQANFRQSLKQPVHRYGGICVYNWGQETAERLGDVDVFSENLFNQDYTGNPNFPNDNGNKNLLTFRDYFSSEVKARKAYEQTIWFRLGFTYDQMCNERNFEKNRYYNRPFADEPVLPGTTTGGDFDIATASSISGTYNNTIALTKPEGAATSQNIAPRLYDNTTQNIPFREAGNQLAYLSNTLQANITSDNENVNNVFAYFSSFWRKCSGTIVLGGGKPIRALQLPRLAEQGYYLITSNVLDQHEDSVKGSKNMPLLGIAPLSGTATNDFLNTAEPLVHILNQDKIVNSIKFKVLYPNLKNPDIDENSSILLKIIRPIQQPSQNADGAVATPQQERKFKADGEKKA